MWLLNSIQYNIVLNNTDRTKIILHQIIQFCGNKWQYFTNSISWILKRLYSVRYIIFFLPAIFRQAYLTPLEAACLLLTGKN